MRTKFGLIIASTVVLAGCGLIDNDSAPDEQDPATTTVPTTETSLSTVPAGAPNAKVGATVEREGQTFRTEIRTERREVAPGSVVEVPIFVEVPVPAPADLPVSQFSPPR